MRIGDSSQAPAPGTSLAAWARAAGPAPDARPPLASDPLARPAPARSASAADLPPRSSLLPGLQPPLQQRQAVTAAKIAAALAALVAQPLRSIASIGDDVGLGTASINLHLAPDGQCRKLDKLAAFADYAQHADSIAASLRRLGHAAQADELASLARRGTRARPAQGRAPAPKTSGFDAHKLVAALRYFQRREVARAAGRLHDDTMLRSVDDAVGVKPHLVSNWVSTAGELVKPRESVARLPGYLECRDEIRRLLVSFGHTAAAASLLDCVPLRQQPSAKALSLALHNMAHGTDRSVRATTQCSGLGRNTLNRFLVGDTGELARKIGTLPDYDAHAGTIRTSLQRLGRDALAAALPATTGQQAVQRKANSPVPWPAHVFAERVGGNMHKVEAVARLVRAGVPLVEATRQAQAHKALILPLLDDKGALRKPTEVIALLNGVDIPAERRIQELMSWLSRRLDPPTAQQGTGPSAPAGARAKRMPAQELLDRASATLNPIVATSHLLREAPAASRGAAARSVGAAPAVVRLLLDRQGTLQHPLAIERSLDGLDAGTRRRLQALTDRLGERLGQTPQPPADRAAPMRSVTLSSGVFGKPRLLVVDRRTRVPEQQKKEGLYQQNPGLVQGPRSFAHDRHRQPLRWLSTALKEKFPNSLEVQCYFDPASRHVVVSTNRTYLNKQIADFVRSGGLAELLAGKPPAPAAPQNDRVERHFAKLVGRMDPASDPHPTERSDAVFAAIAEGRIVVPERDTRVEGSRVAVHAERRIANHVNNTLKAELDLSNLAGTMRPCGDCAEALDAGPEVHRGPFFTSQAAGAFTATDENRARNERDGVGTSITRARDGRLTFEHDTDSDSDAWLSDDGAPAAASARSRLAPTEANRKRGLNPLGDDHTLKRPRVAVATTGATSAASSSTAPPADFDWGRHLRSLGGGEPPPGMVAPHAHHIVFQNGRGARMCAYLDESRAILARHGVDPLMGRENLVWAPNKNHSTAAARAVRDALAEADRTGSREAVAAALARLGRHFADRTINTLYK